uniref:Roundabout homolog 2-like n=1 Tax=Oncorhynchus tshawytscha TaxID=74940 RepID=A0A8C8G108_ONCTS
MVHQISVVTAWIVNFFHLTGSRARFEDSSPRILEDPSDLIVSKGEPATLNCKAEGRPNPTVEWYKDRERVETDRDDPRSHRMLLPSGSLFFLRIVHGRRSKPDEGVYTCVARNYLGEAVSRNASLEVAILRDDFRQAPSDVVVAAGEPAVLECVPPRGHPEPTVSWKRNNARVSSKDDRISMRGGKLMISYTRKSDAGMYVCVGTNMVGERDSDPAELVVYERPVLIRRPVNQVVMEEETVDFLCEVHGDPAPTIRWRREEGELPRGRFEIHSDNSLRLTRVRGEDGGTYTCMSENSVGKTEASATLEVHVPPQITIKPQDQISAQGCSVTFRCGTRGNPSPAIFWKKEGSQMLLFPGQPLSQSGRYSVSMSGELSITDVHLEDSGYYICQAISVAGSVLTKALLEVEGGPSERVPPIIRQGPANQTLGLGSIAQLQCHAIGGPSLRIMWEKDGERIVGGDPRMTLMENGTLQITNVEDSGMYTCVVSSATGESSWSGTLTIREDGAPGSSVPRVSESIQLPGPPQKPVVTDVTRNTVTLTWQSNPHEGGAAVTSYIIEAFSQSVGSVWQTVADHVKQEKHTVIGLYPNTVYLFIVRAVNSYGLSDPSPISEPIRTQDGSPTEQGVDRRQVQRELGEVSLYLQKPVVLSPSSAQVSWTVARQSQYVQGFRLLYRSTGSAWLVQNVKVGPELTTVLSDLHTDTEYEVKVRPYFNELQGLDSPLVQLRTPEEVLSAPPQAVSVVQLSNSSSISVSWEPPPADVQSGTVLEYKVWCLGSDTELKTESHINRTVDGAGLSILLTGLLPDLQYSVMVAAVTNLGVGEHSPPIDLVLGESKDNSLSLSEQITGVVSQPAFIAGLGVASWLVLMGFSGWLYCRHRRRKELGHYTTSFAYTPAGILRPGMLDSNMGNYPWLADSWPAPGLAHNGKDSVNCCSGKLDSTDRYYNGEIGISNYLSQSEKYSSVSTDSPIYSTINTAAAEDLQGLAYYNKYSNTPYTQGSNTPYTQGSNTPYTQGSNTPYTQGSNTPYTQGSNTPYTQDSNTPYSQGPDPYAITPVLSNSGLFGLEQDLDQDEGRNSSDEDEEDWCPPLPARTYLMEGSRDELPSLPSSRREELTQGSTSSLRSTAILPPSPQEETHPLNPNDSPPLQHFDLLACYGPSSHVSHSNHNLFANKDDASGPYDVSGPYHTNQWGDTSMGESYISERSGGGGQMKAVFFIMSCQSVCADLPPPPAPPPAADDPLQLLADVLGCSRTPSADNSPALQRREDYSSPHKRGDCILSSADEGVIPYCPSSFLPRGQMSDYGSLGGGASSRASTGQRGPGAVRRRDEVSPV